MAYEFFKGFFGLLRSNLMSKIEWICSYILKSKFIVEAFKNEQMPKHNDWTYWTKNWFQKKTNNAKIMFNSVALA